MKNYATIKSDYQKTTDQLIEKHKIFFAFSISQLEEGMKKVGAKEKSELTNLDMGMIALKTEADPFMESMAKAYKQYKKDLKEAKEAKESAIYYELNNHECFYSGNIDPVVEMFEDIYTKEEIKQVYKKYYSQEKPFINKEND